MVVYLASDLAANVNGCGFRIGAGKIALYSHPTETRGIYRNYKKVGPWPIEEAKELLPRTVLAGETRAPHIP
ncbi:MAG: hypothetical protein HY671_06665 [Chloroflexi bacterium]|nr:hypothetical protein [Chloroflexota bacterium]